MYFWMQFSGFSSPKFSQLFIQFPADLVTLTEEILNGELHFLCSKAYLQPSQISTMAILGENS